MPEEFQHMGELRWKGAVAKAVDSTKGWMCCTSDCTVLLTAECRTSHMCWDESLIAVWVLLKTSLALASTHVLTILRTWQGSGWVVWG